MWAGRHTSFRHLKPVPETDSLLLMRLVNEQYMRHPEFGYPRDGLAP